MAVRRFAWLLVLAACCAPSAPPRQVRPAAETAPGPYARTDGLPGGVRVSFALRHRQHDGQPGGFYGAPWPSELWRTDGGHLDFSSFPARDTFLLADTIAEAAREIDAFSVSPVIYFHFTGPIDPARLPDPRGSLSPAAPVALVDVDPSSPERGTRFPVEHRYFADDLRFVPAHTLAIKPLPGFVLRPKTLYAAVLRRGLTEPPLGTTADFELTKWTEPHRDPVRERARALHAPVLDRLAADGIDRAEVAALAVFRTQQPHATFRAMVEAASALPPQHAPQLLRAEWLAEGESVAPYRVVRGYYCTPNYQRDIDQVPFLDRGGTVVVGPSGGPRVQPLGPASPYRTAECGERLRARFVLTVPRCPMPEAGWPLLVVSHGSTGDAFAFVGEDNFAGWAARECVAAVSTDQPLHGGRDPVGARPGSRTPFRFRIGGIPIRLPVEGNGAELAFYHPLRPPVMRDNLRQAGIDAVLLSRLVLGTDFATSRTAAGQLVLAPRGSDPAPRFDRTRLFLAGHSQGSQSTAAVGAVDPLVRGVVLSGCGGAIRLAFAHRKDTNARAVVQLLLRLEDGELDEFHPLLALVQTLLDPVDPQTWARLYLEPLPGRRPRSALHFEGLADTMTLPAMAEALAVALRARPLEPLLSSVTGLELLGISPATTVSRNAVGGGATLALVQLAPADGRDGHYVLYDQPRASGLVRAFLAALARGETAPTVGPLPPGPLTPENAVGRD